eukprot:120455-Chlamydomonas_euryale.AAC.1
MLWTHQASFSRCCTDQSLILLVLYELSSCGTDRPAGWRIANKNKCRLSKPGYGPPPASPQITQSAKCGPTLAGRGCGPHRLRAAGAMRDAGGGAAGACAVGRQTRCVTRGSVGGIVRKLLERGKGWV